MVPAVSNGASPTPPYSGYHCLIKLYPYGTITLYGLVSHPAQVRFIITFVVLQPLSRLNGTGLGSCAFARHYWRNHYCFLFLQVLRCFSSLGLLPDGKRQGDIPSVCRVAPFGHLRINSYLPIPAAFRSLSRPSSPLRA